MKKLFSLVCFLMILILVGCNKGDNIIFQYVDKTNFNQYFDIKLDIEPDQYVISDDEHILNYDVYNITIEIIPRFGAEIKVLDCDIDVDFIYQVLQNESWRLRRETISFHFNLDDSKNDYIKQLSAKINEVYSRPRNVKVLSYEVTFLHAYVNTYEKPKYLENGFVSNKDNNRNNYDQMISYLNLCDRLFESNYINYDIKKSRKRIDNSIKGNFSTEKTNAKFIKEPIYSEILYSEKIYNIIKNENNQFFKYIYLQNDNDLYFNLDSRNVIERSELEDNFNINSAIAYADLGFTFDLDFKKIAIVNNNYNFEISGYYRDLVESETILELQNEFLNRGYQVEAIKDSVFKMNIFNQNGIIYFFITIDILLDVDSVYMESIITSIKISFDEFSKTIVPEE